MDRIKFIKDRELKLQLYSLLELSEDFWCFEEISEIVYDISWKIEDYEDKILEYEEKIELIEESWSVL